jgi:hypothetical protein
MKHLLLGSALLFGGACGGAGTPAVTNQGVSDGAVTLTSVPPRVGDRWIEENIQSMHLDITARGQQVPMIGYEHEVKAIEVLAVGGALVTKEKVTYTTVEHSQTVGGRESLEPPVIAGKTYTIEAGDPLVVTTDAGPAADAEAQAVQDAEKDFGKPDRFGKLLEGKTFQKDEAVDLSADEIAAANDDGDDAKFTSVTMTYRGMAGELALFDMAVTVEQDTPGEGRLDMFLTGTARVDPTTNEPAEATLEGTMTMTGPTTAHGTMTISEKHTR